MKLLDTNGSGVDLMQDGKEFVVINILGRELLRTPERKYAEDLLDYYKRKAHPVLKDFTLMHYSGSLKHYWE